MNKSNIVAILIAIIIIGCSSSKVKMSPNPMINEIVKNYYKTNKRYFKDYSVFHIERKQMKNEELEVFKVLPENDKIAFTIYLEDSLNKKHLPTNYLEYKGKLFLWQEENQKISDSVMQYIYNKKLVDSSYVKYKMGLISEEEVQDVVITIDENLKGVNYIFCKYNPSKIMKKIKSNTYIKPDDRQLQVNCLK